MTDKLQQRIYELALACFNDRLTAEEVDELRMVLEESSENRKFFRDCRELFVALSAGEAFGKYDASTAFSKFKSLHSSYFSHPSHPSHSSRSSRSSRLRSGMASHSFGKSIATVSAFAAIAFVLCFFSFRMGSEKTMDSFADMVIESPLGSRTRVVLPDSTEVWLNAGSRICYSQGFGVEDRTVRLSGEGHFDVTPNPDKPFVVNTAELSVKVLGTKFNFRNYDSDMEATVSLEEGKVALTNMLKQSFDSYLAPNQKCVLNKCSGELTINKSKVQRSSSWVEGQLFFDEELLTDIARELERSYNVQITIENEYLEGYRFYGDFTRKCLTIDEVLDAFCATGRIHSKKDYDGNITLY